ncbi:MAG: NAD(P)/FAD-dependent oxidoreductase [Epsilonproteobacteria bacterium]|nr:NAD(P)/FAD-dependent oxidoreductase [Campylobacterota bacterium]
MSNITRRNFFKILTTSVGATLLSNANEGDGSHLKAQKSQLLPKNSKQQRVVVVGGGIGGLTVAENIKLHDPDNKIEVILLERNTQYFACPMSNTLFGEIKEVEDANISFHFDYSKAEKNHNIDVIITEVIDADVNKKILTTTLGTIDYDYVVVAPGIDYNYKKLFPTWSDEKIRRATKETPAAMFSDSGKEKQNLLNQLQEWKKSGGEGYFVIVPPKGGKVRCKPASYERACMVSEFIKKYKLSGKVHLLDNSPKPQAKGPQFIEVFIKSHKETIIFNGMSGEEMESRIKKAGFTLDNFMKKENFSKVEDSFATCDIQDVDFDKKEIIFNYADNFDDEGKVSKLSYAIANIIPYHRGNRTAELFDVKRDKWGGIICSPNKTYSVSNAAVYVAGDIMGYHKFDPSAQASASVGMLTGESIAKRILTNKDEIDLTKAGITCYSMISNKPLKAIEISKGIMVTHDGIAKASSSKLDFRDGMGLIGWYQAMIETPFKY